MQNKGSNKIKVLTKGYKLTYLMYKSDIFGLVLTVI